MSKRIRLINHGKGLMTLFVKDTWYQLSEEEIANLREELAKE